MKELFRSNDLVLISWAEALLRDNDIEPLVLDAHTAILEGSIGAIQRRLMVIDEDHARARWLIETHRPEEGGA